VYLFGWNWNIDDDDDDDDGGGGGGGGDGDDFYIIIALLTKHNNLLCCPVSLCTQYSEFQNIVYSYSFPVFTW
jgi:hypothetical protein